MAGTFDQALLDRVRDAVDLVDLVGTHVKIKKSGTNYVGLCPFHSEKSPSFTVSPTKQFFHCFGCGAHGDAFGWLTDYEHYSFPEAVEKLAQSGGIALPAREAPTPEALRAKARSEGLLQLLARASAVFQQQLRTSSKAIDYFKGRGVTGVTARDFGLGYATSNLLQHFPDTPLADLKEAGLLVERDHGELDDKFRHRVMFPIHNEQGAILGFGARTLGNDEPKYLNSAESTVFHKGQELYGLYMAKEAIRRTRVALVLEGYMDVIALHQHGEKRAVGALGTSVTLEQLQRLYRLCDHVVFAMDGDAAGRKAANRAAKLVLEVIPDGKTARFVRLPADHDPDSFVREHGLPGWEAYVADHAEPLSARLSEILIADRDLKLPEHRADIARETGDLLATIRFAPALQEALRTHVETQIGMAVRLKGQGRRQGAAAPADGANQSKGPVPDRSRITFYENFARLCQLSPHHTAKVPSVLIDDFAALISGWFDMAPTDAEAREAEMERIPVPALQRVVRAAIVGVRQREAELGAALASGEVDALLHALQRDARHAASVQKTSALFATTS
ncbi:DNA primase [Cupriavidus sp. TMH.W2]|uniref:DNA primase n=1 Tax=Cupriavidus sp. TMH.W2 TaxID=3434465 RepID=UPI003D784C3E